MASEPSIRKAVPSAFAASTIFRASRRNSSSPRETNFDGSAMLHGGLERPPTVGRKVGTQTEARSVPRNRQVSISLFHGNVRGGMTPAGRRHPATQRLMARAQVTG